MKPQTAHPTMPLPWYVMVKPSANNFERPVLLNTHYSSLDKRSKTLTICTHFLSKLEELRGNPTLPFTSLAKAPCVPQPLTKGIIKPQPLTLTLNPNSESE